VVPDYNEKLIVGNGVYMWCKWCDKLVKMNKFILGSLHICLTEEEKYVKAKRLGWKNLS